MPTNTPRATAFVDGTQMLYRAEFGFPSRIRNRAGHDVTGLFGFLALTRKALSNSPIRPTHALVVFDADAPTRRSRLDARYRAGRRLPAAGAEHSPFRHLPWIVRALEVWKMSCIEHESAEADDVIASSIAQGSARRGRSILVSRDKDFHQLVTAHVTQWDSARGTVMGWTTPERIVERYGIRASQWCDYVALVGDRSDGMPGVRGIGPITAARLLREGRDLDDIAEELTDSNLAEARHQRDLHRLLTDVELPSTEPSPLPAEGPTPAASVLDELGLWDATYP